MAEIKVESFLFESDGEAHRKLRVFTGGKGRELKAVRRVTLQTVPPPFTCFVILVFLTVLFLTAAFLGWAPQQASLNLSPSLKYLPPAVAFTLAVLNLLSRKPNFRVDVFCSSGHYFMITKNGRKARTTAQFVCEMITGAK